MRALNEQVKMYITLDYLPYFACCVDGLTLEGTNALWGICGFTTYLISPKIAAPDIWYLRVSIYSILLVKTKGETRNLNSSPLEV